MLIVRQRGHHDFVMKLVGHGHHYDLPRRQRGDGFAVELRLGRTVAIGPGAEGLARESALSLRRCARP